MRILHFAEGGKNKKGVQSPEDTESPETSDAFVRFLDYNTAAGLLSTEFCNFISGIFQKRFSQGVFPKMLRRERDGFCESWGAFHGGPLVIYYSQSSKPAGGGKRGCQAGCAAGTGGSRFRRKNT